MVLIVNMIALILAGYVYGYTNPYLVKDIGLPLWDYITAVNGKVYFKVGDINHGTELWVSDGTESGTMLVKYYYPYPGSYLGLENVTGYNGKIYFQAYDVLHGMELWVSNDTSSGTRMVKDIYPGVDGSHPSGLTDCNGKIYFGANDGSHGYELWISDGTKQGTTMVKDIYPGSNNPSLGDFTGYNGKLYFRADDGSHGSELWVSDGTESGTMIVKDIYPGVDSSSPSELTACNGKIYFKATDGSHGSEPWVSDGTDQGTTMVKDIYSGINGSGPDELTECSGLLCFRSYLPSTGDELWVSDGTEPGTIMVKDIYPGTVSSSPSYLTEANGKLYFQANDGSHGESLYALSFCGDGIIQPGEGCEQQSDCDVDYYCDTCLCISVDVDDDGILYYEDTCPEDYNPEQTDSDGDEIGDVCDECPNDFENDIEGDGVCGDEDNCPDISNPEQENADGDGYGDACDEDDDNDGIMDDDDNCPFMSNFDQLDTDSDGIGDVCDDHPYIYDLLEVTDGHYVQHEYCCVFGIGGCRGTCYEWSTHSEIIIGYEITTQWPNPPFYDFSVGVMEFNLAGIEGIFTSGLISAELSLTVKNGILNSSCPSLYDVADDFENGELGEYEDDYDYNGGMGDFIEQVCTDLQPGTVITFDVTASLEHDLFDLDQSGFAGFVLYPADGPYIEFYDHTDPENGPRLTIINKDLDGDGISVEEDNCPDDYNPHQIDCDSDGTGDMCDTDTMDMDDDGVDDACDNCPSTSNPSQEDTDSSGIGNACNDLIDADSDEWEDSLDNCPNTSNTFQEDSRPPQGNGIGDACECEGDFSCDGDVDGSDASTFKVDFGRSVMENPCVAGDTCNGDFYCDGDVDGTDASLFKQDFGRSSMQNPCPVCVAGEWCTY